MNSMARRMFELVEPIGVIPYYSFAPGEVARHIPKVWRTTTPEAAIAARQGGCVKALRRIFGDQVDSPGFARAADLLTRAATSAPVEGRPMYAVLRAIPIPEEVVARLFHAASLLREHRGDAGPVAAAATVSPTTLATRDPSLSRSSCALLCGDRSEG